VANPEHFEIWQEGVDAWNAWRDLNRDITPDLSAADLSLADLRQAELRGVNLRGVDLSNTDLSAIDLSHTDLSNACLIDANLRNATLHHADFSHADLSLTDLRNAALSGVDFSFTILIEATLSGATLSGAILDFANFTTADLSGADLSEASLCGTVFGDTNLTAVRGLETCDHHAPSTLDLRTLAKSGPLPLAFLRGCGLPDALINYLPSLLNEPIQFYSCFISYASKDHAFAERLYADLQNQGVRCWFAPEDMKIGDRLRLRIDETIRLYDKLLLILSKTSVASQWVEQEVETALARERQQGTTILFPVRIDNTVMTLKTGWPALIRHTRNIGDFRRWKTHGVYQKAFDWLLRDLKAADRQPEGARPVG
jgi:uncharacterized protein YjbI with pentapeptide repeats